MRTELADLLQRRPVVHPSTIESVQVAGRHLRLVVSGYRWWAEAYGELWGSIELHFHDIFEGMLDPSDLDREDDKALDRLEVLPADQVPWLGARESSIFCSAPVPEPLKVFARLHDYLARAGAFRRPADFLNQCDQLDDFCRLAGTSSFHLGQAPPVIRDLLTEELQRQGVAHNVLHQPTDDIEGLFVRLGGSQFHCAEAWAHIDDDQQPTPAARRASAGGPR